MDDWADGPLDDFALDELERQRIAAHDQHLAEEAAAAAARAVESGASDAAAKAAAAHQAEVDALAAEAAAAAAEAAEAAADAAAEDDRRKGRIKAPTLDPTAGQHVHDENGADHHEPTYAEISAGIKAAHEYLLEHEHDADVAPAPPQVPHIPAYMQAQHQDLHFTHGSAPAQIPIHTKVI